MRKFFVQLLIIAALITLCDITIGYYLNLILLKTTIADNGRNNRINHEIEDDIIFLGSSRCLHHYIPQILEDSLGLTCYNAGTDGEGILLSYVHAQFILNRHKPKLIVYDVAPHYDYFPDNNIRHLRWLRCEYNEPFVKDVIWDVDKTEFFKMKSYLYRVNDNVIETLRDYFHSPILDIEKGYSGVRKMMTKEEPSKPRQNFEIDSIKVAYMEQFISICQEHKIPLLFYISPTYKAQNDREYTKLYQLADKYNVKVYNHLTDSLVYCNNKLFGDSQHLNVDGAEVYTKIICKEIKDYLHNLNK